MVYAMEDPLDAVGLMLKLSIDDFLSAFAVWRGWAWLGSAVPVGARLGVVFIVSGQGSSWRGAASFGTARFYSWHGAAQRGCARYG